MALGALAWVLLVREGDLPEPATTSPTTHLEQKKKTLYDNLRDLQFEYRLGKLTEPDYQEAKKILQQELSRLTAQLEGKAAAQAAEAKPKAPGGAGPATGREVQAATACAHCGAQFPQPLKFCGECGRPMSGGKA